MPDFYISITDLWILCIKYNMPVILLSPNPRGLRENNKMLLPLQISEDSNYVFIISDSPRTDKPHKYSIVSKSEKISDSIINIYKSYKCLQSRYSLVSGHLPYDLYDYCQRFYCFMANNKRQRLGQILDIIKP